MLQELPPLFRTNVVAFFFAKRVTCGEAYISTEKMKDLDLLTLSRL